MQTLSKKDREFLRAGRKLAHEERNRRAFWLYEQDVIDGKRTPRIREDKSPALFMKHTIKAARKNNRRAIASRPVQSKLFSL